MEPASFLEMAEFEERHWWFVARRRILRRMARRTIASLALPQRPKILEIGAGTGGNLAMLAAFGDVTAIEGDPVARDYALRKAKAAGIAGGVMAGTLPNGLPLLSERYDLICMFDVLEHVEPDRAALRAVRGLLKPGGRLVIAVPALPVLWSRHDEVLHHFRRYTARSLRETAQSAGLECRRISHFNTLLLPAIAGARILDRIRGNRSDTGTAMPPPWINAALRGIFGSEAALLSVLDLPIGASLFAELAPGPD